VNHRKEVDLGIGPNQNEWRRYLARITDTTTDNSPDPDLYEEGTRWVPPAQYSPVYDADGNLTNDGRWDYAWDAENRLIQMKTTQSISTNYDEVILDFTYDWRGRRISKKVTKNGSVIKDLRFVYDDWNLIAELDGANSNALVRTYTWGMDLSGSLQGAGGVGGLLSMEVSDGASMDTVFPSYDGNGNIIAWSESKSGASDNPVLQRRDYDPFGNLLSKQDLGDIPGGAIPFGFSTKYEDSETGLLYYGYRYYDPVTGRWPSRDPIEERGGTNLYGMVGNDIVNVWDVLGFYPGLPGHGDPVSPKVSSATVSRIEVYSRLKTLDEASRLLRVGTALDNVYDNLQTTKIGELLGKGTYNTFKDLGDNRLLGSNENNLFVYTCKHGWVDHGHFFNNARGAYKIGVGDTETLAETMERLQEHGGFGLFDQTSAWAPEDLISNDLGRKFGELARKHDGPVRKRLYSSSVSVSDFMNLFKVGEQWDKHLKKWGAVKWGTGIVVDGKTVRQILQEDIERYKNTPVLDRKFTTMGSARGFQNGSPARCLCRGDKPRFHALEY